MTIPGDAPRGTVGCGALRREPDGSWFLGSTFLGRDDDPETSLQALEDTVGLVAMTLANALDQACDQLHRWGDIAAAERARTVLRRFHRWQATGRW